MFTNIKHILTWICRYWYPSIPSQEASTIINQWISQVQRWITCNGIQASIKRIKEIRLITTRYICGQPLKVSSLMIGIDSDGFPICISYMKEYINSKQPEKLRFILTLLGISRTFPSVGPADLKSITEPFKGKYTNIPNDFVEIFVKDFTGHFDMISERPGPTKAFLSLKSGPLGGPAILSAQIAAAKITGVNLWCLAYIGGDKFMDWVKDLKYSVSLSLSHKLGFGVKQQDLDRGVELMNRRFLHIFDPEWKHRIVACFDYISQLALNPFSEWCFDTLRTIEKDRTFTQDPVILDKADGHKYHSFDLSAATDRFPIKLQAQLISEIAGPQFAAAWKGLMINEKFLADRGGLTSDINSPLYTKVCMVKYQVGQPMGGRSSWAVFTLSHHMVVQYAAFQLGLYPFKEYILLGDDIVIYHDQVAEKYLTIIEDLGVEISRAKSHISEDTYEFAKRWFHKGIEISPIPLAGFVDNWHSPKLLYNQILDLIYKGRGPRSIIKSPVLAAELLKVLRTPLMRLETNPYGKTIGGFYEFMVGDYLSKNLKRAYSRNQIHYFTKVFDELNLVFRNLKEFQVEQTRAFMAQASSTNDYILPSDEATLFQEWIRTSSGVVNGMAMSVVRRLSLFFKEFVKAYDETLVKTGCESVETKIAHHPLTWAVYNSVKRYHKMNKDMGYTTDLSRQLETITLIDIDKLRTRERTSINLVFTYSTLGRRLFYQLRDDPYLYIAKAQTMKFGRGLFDIELAMAKAYPNLKLGSYIQ